MTKYSPFSSSLKSREKLFNNIYCKRLIMKKTILLVTLLLITLKIHAQVGIGTTNPDSAAALDIVATDKGFLPPRVADVTTIATPVAGLIIYDLSRQCMKYYNGFIWSDCMGGIIPQVICGETLTDIDGNTYPTVMIGGQCWMAADLKVSRYPNGDDIPYIDNNATWAALADNNTDDAYVFYGDNNNNGIVNIAHPDYGALYTYAAAIGDNGENENTTNQGVCPDGWHLPSNGEFATLSSFLSDGGELKEAGTTHWDSPNTGATNNSGFTALPTGERRANNGGFQLIRRIGQWWSRSATSSTASWLRRLNYDNITFASVNLTKSRGVCVRCVKD